MSTGLPRLRMAIVKLNKLQRMSENMSQLLSNETHMPKNLYQTSSENSYSTVPGIFKYSIHRSHVPQLVPGSLVGVKDSDS
jgi:hypothetical protein